MAGAVEDSVSREPPGDFFLSLSCAGWPFATNLHKLGEPAERDEPGGLTTPAGNLGKQAFTVCRGSEALAREPLEVAEGG